MLVRDNLLQKPRLDEQAMAMRVSREFQDGMVVNLGFGIPTLCNSFVPEDKDILFHAENGVLGYGPITTSPDQEDYDLINASAQFITPQRGMSFFGHAESFSMIRGGHIDISVLGGLQVSQNGALANWRLPGEQVGSVGGAMDLAFGAKKVIVVMTHTTRNGQPKIVKECSYALTAPQCVNLIVTDIAVIEVTKEGLVLKEYAPEWKPEDIQELTEPSLSVSPDLAEIQLL